MIIYIRTLGIVDFDGKKQPLIQ